MTFADETANALYATVCERPECDTARLILADRLDEVGDRDLAEFIRVGCRIAAINAGIQSDEDCGQPGCYECDARRPLLAREAELREAHPEWRKCPCQACDGEGLTYHPWSDTTGRILTVGGPGQSFVCHVCGGTGDLFTEKNHYGEVPAARTVTFSRGFPDSVECTAADVWREEREESRNMDGDGWATRTVPTEWAKAVVRATPVRIFTVGDLEPWDFGGTDRQRGWWREGGAQVRNHATIHGPIYDLIAPEMMLFGAKAFRTEAAARSALGLATGLWVRAAAYPAVPVG